MLRLLVNGLLLSSPIAVRSNNLHSRALANTCRNLNFHYNSMEQPFEKMAEEGVSKCDKPTEVAAPKQEEQALPKLSAKDFRVYNSMAEHMDMFVGVSTEAFYATGMAC